MGPSNYTARWKHARSFPACAVIHCCTCLALACAPARTQPAPTGAERARKTPAPAVPRAAPLAAADTLQDAADPKVRRVLQLTILGEFPREVLAEIEASLRAELQVDVLPTIERDLPQSAYYPPRKRYRAERLLAALEQNGTPGVSQLGLTVVDISTTKGKHVDWGVFGLGTLGGDSAVISVHRLRRDKPAPALYHFRIKTTAVHEAGHMLGLDHCTEPRCLMNDAEGSIRTVDESSGKLGPNCRTELDRLAPAQRTPPHD